MMKKKKKTKKTNVRSSGQPARLMTCANHGESVRCSQTYQCGQSLLDSLVRLRCETFFISFFRSLDREVQLRHK